MNMHHAFNHVCAGANPAATFPRGGSSVPAGGTPFVQSSLHAYVRLRNAADEFRALRNEHIVLLVDDANLSISFQEQSGAPLDYGRLMNALKSTARKVDAHLVVTGVTQEQHNRAEQLGRLGYSVHRIPHPNVDVAVGFVLGRLASVPATEGATWMLATGDGALGLCLAGALHGTRGKARLVTLSVRHTTALALRQCPLIARNFYLTPDLADEPKFHSRKDHCHV